MRSRCLWNSTHVKGGHSVKAFCGHVKIDLMDMRYLFHTRSGSTGARTLFSLTYLQHHSGYSAHGESAQTTSPHYSSSHLRSYLPQETHASPARMPCPPRCSHETTADMDAHLRDLLSALGVTSEEPTTYNMLSQMAQDLLNNSESWGSVGGSTAGSVSMGNEDELWEEEHDYWGLEDEDDGEEAGERPGNGFEVGSAAADAELKTTAVDIIAALRERPHSSTGAPLFEPWRSSELEPMLVGTLHDGQPIRDHHVPEYRELLDAVVRHNTSISAPGRLGNAPTQPLDVPWLKRRTRERWAQRYETATGRALLELKAQLKSSTLTGLDRLLYGPNLKYFRRLAYRKMGDECRRDVLGEFAQSMHAARDIAVRELALLQLMYHGQRAELKCRIQAPLSLADVVEEQHANLAQAAAANLCFVESEVEVSETLVDMAEGVMERVERSTAELLARDVQGKMARREESQRRFGLPDSFGSMLVSLEDLDMVRETAQSVLGLAEQMGKELEQIALTAVDAVGATKDLLLLKELTRSPQ
ncbi:hypothetical protein HDK77DRAFT_442932 [Phyllosticta capitalensis]|uniref:Uncharacterized protein n=1 Tax=Phyllosticta capitalensis TaxID=121624 RepID=A0ABR1YP53_9PEZI